MDLDNLFRLLNNFYYTHTYAAIGIIAAIAILALLKPKLTAKALLILVGVVVVGYILYFIGGAVWSGFSDKNQMLHKY